MSCFFGWLIKAFNKVDRNRLKLVGPDCACAEWLLRNGASVLLKGHSKLLSDYNELIKLEETDASLVKVEEIYARKVYLHSLGTLQGIEYSSFNSLHTFLKVLLLIEARIIDKFSPFVLTFDHLKDCNHVKKITLIFCTYIDDSALFKLKYIKNSLQYLEIRSCFNINDKGLHSLSSLRNLNTLILANLASVENKDECETVLKQGLPQCKIDFQK